MAIERTNVQSLLHIVEGSASCYTYHLSMTGGTGKPSLCGSTHTMATRIPLALWNNKPGHIRSKYCTQCSKIAKDNGYNIKDADSETLVFTRTSPTSNL